MFANNGGKRPREIHRSFGKGGAIMLMCYLRTTTPWDASTARMRASDDDIHCEVSPAMWDEQHMKKHSVGYNENHPLTAKHSAA